MNSNKFIPIIGLLIMLILAIGSISASDVDSESVGEAANMDLKVEEAIIDDSNVIEEENNAYAIADEETNDAYGIEDMENEADVENSLGSSQDEDVLASTVKFNESQYSTYFNGSGNIISGKLKAGDTLDFSGNFNSKTFIINIPLKITSSDKTAKFTNCNFKIVKGSQGTNITNLKASMNKLSTPIIDVFNVSDIIIANCDFFSNATGSYGILFNTVNRSSITNNKIQTTCYVNGWGHPSAIVLSGTFYNNISNNNVITNDSNGIYLTGFLGGGTMGQTGGVNAYNTIFNNTVHSIRGIDGNDNNLLPSSFTYGIQIMGANNEVIKNTIYNVYRGIGTTQAGNKIINNSIYNIHGNWYSGNTNDTGGDYAIYATVNSIVKDNIILDSKVSKSIIYVSKNCNVTGNVIKNCTGMGLTVDGSNVTITENNFNVSAVGVYIYGDYSDINIESNVIDSNDQFAIRLQKKSRMEFPHDIIIQNNTLYSTSEEGAIYKDPICTYIMESGNTIIGTSGVPVIDSETTHLINENNFDKYFSMGSFNSNRIKENDTIIFVGTFPSKGELTINEKVTIQGANAVFKDTTFIVSDIDGVVIEDLKISNPNTSLLDRLWGIQISNSNNITIKNCDISIYDPYSAFAVYVLDSDDCRIINSSLKAEGNYFTAALFSFNSTNLLINGSTIETIGSGDTYLNNRSCLNVLLNGATICPDGSIMCPDGTMYSREECDELENGTIVCPDGTQVCVDGSTICADGTTICPDGSVICTDGTTICADGSIICADGTTIAAGEYTTDENGNIICPDGSVICVGGSGTTGELDGVIPGTHMISGLFRTYGALFVHTSNVNFTNNKVNVGSRLDPFYDLNESCNTIAGVFIHYGGFNNTIANNNITLESNDPVIYGIGIIGASPNSTAEGSKNNSFIDNNVSIKGPYYGVGIYLGYKALNSTFANNIEISAINALEKVNRTLVEDDENIMENEFEVITPHNTELTVTDASYKWNNGNKYLSVTLKDANGTAISNQVVVLNVGGANYTGATDANGIAKIKVSISKVGAFDVSAYFYGEGILLASSSAGKLTLGKDSTSMSSAGKTYTVTTASKTITVTLRDGSGNLVANRKVAATVNRKTYYATTNSKGVATFNLALNAVKTYTVSLKFAGDSYYTASSSSVKVKVTKTKTKLTVPKKTYKAKAKTKKLTATLKDQTGKAIKSKKVTFIVNKKKYTAKTNKKGVATVKVKLSKKKTYKFTVKFAGDKTYVAVKKTGKVKIK